MRSTIDMILFISIIVSTLIATYITVQHVVLKNNHKSYDTWLLPALLAVLLQMYENK